MFSMTYNRDPDIPLASTTDQDDPIETTINNKKTTSPCYINKSDKRKSNEEIRSNDSRYPQMHAPIKLKHRYWSNHKLI